MKAATTLSHWTFDGDGKPPREVTRITVKEGVTNIPDEAFYQCAALKCVKLPLTLTKIGESAFSHCHSLALLSIPEGVKIIGDYAFCQCFTLQHVILPLTLTTLGGRAFVYCSSLKFVVAPSIKSIQECVFQYCTSLSCIIVPFNSNIHDTSFKGCKFLLNGRKSNVFDFHGSTTQTSYKLKRLYSAKPSIEITNYLVFNSNIMIEMKEKDDKLFDDFVSYGNELLENKVIEEKEEERRNHRYFTSGNLNGKECNSDALSNSRKLESRLEDTVDCTSQLSSMAVSSLHGRLRDNFDHRNLAIDDDNKYQNDKRARVGDNLDTNKSNNELNSNNNLPHNNLKAVSDTEAKDLVALGTTVAMLGQSQPVTSVISASTQPLIDDSKNHVRVAELDHLVAAENFDVVVLAATNHKIIGCDKSSKRGELDWASIKFDNSCTTSASFLTTSERLENDHSKNSDDCLEYSSITESIGGNPCSVTSSLNTGSVDHLVREHKATVSEIHNEYPNDEMACNLKERGNDGEIIKYHRKVKNLQCRLHVLKLPAKESKSFDLEVFIDDDKILQKLSSEEGGNETCMSGTALIRKVNVISFTVKILVDGCVTLPSIATLIWNAGCGTSPKTRHRVYVLESYPKSSQFAGGTTVYHCHVEANGTDRTCDFAFELHEVIPVKQDRKEYFSLAKDCGRHVIIRSINQNLDFVLQKLDKQLTILARISKGNRFLIFEPDESKHWSQPETWLNSKVNFIFLDAVTFKRVNTKNNGDSFPLLIPKKWVRNMLPYLKLSLTVLKIAAIAGQVVMDLKFCGLTRNVESIVNSLLNAVNGFYKKTKRNLIFRNEKFSKSWDIAESCAVYMLDSISESSMPQDYLLLVQESIKDFETPVNKFLNKYGLIKAGENNGGVETIENNIHLQKVKVDRPKAMPVNAEAI